MSVSSEQAMRYVCDRILKPMGINLSPKAILKASTNEEEPLDDIKSSLYLFLGKILTKNDREARSWAKACTSEIATDVLSLLGFESPFLSIESNSQHILICLFWLIWRTNQFQSLYSRYLPADKSLLPPYHDEVSNECETGETPSIPTSSDSLYNRIQYLNGRLNFGFNALSDLEMQRETLNMKIRALDPDSDLYTLKLKSNPSLLKDHVEALSKAIDGHSEIKKIAEIESVFWKWATSVAENLEIDGDAYERTRSDPIDFYPVYSMAPVTRHNQKVNQLGKLYNEFKMKLEAAREALKFVEAPQQRDILKHEIDKVLNPIENIEEIEETKKETASVGLIPEMPFKDFSDMKLETIRESSRKKIEQLESQYAPQIANFAEDVARELGYKVHGFKSK